LGLLLSADACYFPVLTGTRSSFLQVGAFFSWYHCFQSFFPALFRLINRTFCLFHPVIWQLQCCKRKLQGCICPMQCCKREMQPCICPMQCCKRKLQGCICPMQLCKREMQPCICPMQCCKSELQGCISKIHRCKREIHGCICQMPHVITPIT